MYANKFAVAVKHRGKVLQEFGETVYLPFGSEYGLLLKNLNSVRATVKVSIDGQDATEGVNLVVQPNSSIEIERFIKNGNLNAGNRFKFIARTAAIEQHRGAKLDDGLIRVSYAFEAPTQLTWIAGPVTTIQSNPWPYSSTCESGALRSMTGGAWTSGSSSVYSSNTASSAPAVKGVTAPGSVSTQQFQPVGGFQTEAVTHVIMLQLAGQSAETASGSVQNVVYTRSKIGCTMCGYKAKPTSKFCSQCGSSLTIIS